MEDQIYVIGPPDGSIVKIGVSTNPSRRLLQLQSSSPVRLAIHWMCAGSYPMEEALHRSFSAYRKHGEWFDFGGANPTQLISKAVQTLTENGLGAAVPLPTDDVGEPDCVCGHRAARHRFNSTRECTVAGQQEWLDCQCSAYTSNTVLSSAGASSSRPPASRPKAQGWQGPTPTARAQAREDVRFSGLCAAIGEVKWPGGGAMVPGYWPDSLATGILWRLHGCPPADLPGVVLAEVAGLTWPHGGHMVPGGFADELAEHLVSLLLGEERAED